MSQRMMFRIKVAVLVAAVFQLSSFLGGCIQVLQAISLPIQTLGAFDQLGILNLGTP